MPRKTVGEFFDGQLVEEFDVDRLTALPEAPDPVHSDLAVALALIPGLSSLCGLDRAGRP